MTMRRFALAALPAQPWKNGGGVTREIAALPAGSTVDDFVWRVSVAEIAQAGPFSPFPGVDRQIMLLSGAGVRLRGDGIDHRLDRPLQPFAFAGEAAIDASLLDGPSHDLNVMTRRDAMRAEVQVAYDAVTVAACDALVLLASRGGWRGLSLEAGEGVVMADGSAGLRMTPVGAGGALIVIRLIKESIR
jgi:environmental stress-induced protein Ves